MSPGAPDKNDSRRNNTDSEKSRYSRLKKYVIGGFGGLLLCITTLTGLQVREITTTIKGIQQNNQPRFASENRRDTPRAQDRPQTTMPHDRKEGDLLIHLLEELGEHNPLGEELKPILEAMDGPLEAQLRLANSSDDWCIRQRQIITGEFRKVRENHNNASLDRTISNIKLVRQYCR